MPSFEDSEPSQSNKQTYTPSTDAKPRTRRRSGGFKKEHAPVQTGIGEVDPVDALKNERLSGTGKPEPEQPRKKPVAKKAAAPRKAAPAAKKEDRPAPAPSGKAKPSAETLAAIQRVEARIEERRKERDAKRAEREKNKPEKPAKKSAPKKDAAPQAKKKQGGLIASILKLFGLGPKEPAKKSSKGPRRDGGKRPQGKGQGSRGKGQGGNRPQGKGGNGRGGQGRRRGGKGGARRSDRRNNETVS